MVWCGVVWCGVVMLCDVSLILCELTVSMTESDFVCPVVCDLVVSLQL